MAFFTANGEQCRVKWPYGIGVVDPQPEQVPNWRTLPTDYDGLCDRVSVDGFGPYNRRVIFTHMEANSQEAVGLALRLQGVVTDVNINTLGNWTGNAEDAPKAMQWLSLGGGKHPQAFRPQQDGVRNLGEVVRAMINAPSSDPHPRDGTIKLQRRVFTRVRADEPCASIKFGRHEDSDGRAAKIVDQWRVDHRVKTGAMEEGQFVPKHTLSIRRGDLVDVLATIEIVSMRGRNGRKTEIYLIPSEVVKLASAQELQAVAKQVERDVSKPIAGPTASSATGGSQKTLFAFGHDGTPVASGDLMETAE